MLLTETLLVADGEGLHLPGRDAPVLSGRSVSDLALDGDTVYALVDRREVHAVEADGSTARIAELAGPVATCVHVHAGRVWVGGDAAGLWRLEGERLLPVPSFEDAPTRAEWHTPWGGPPSVLSMASHGDDLYVGVHVGGILRSSDDGATWTDTIDLHVDVHQVTVSPDGATVWAANGERGLAESTDRGATWRFHTDGLHATYALAAAATSDGVLVGASSGHAARDGVVYRFEPAAHRFQRVDGLPEPLGGAVGPRDIAARGDRTAVVVPGGDVYESADGGRTWTPVPGITGATAIALR